MKLMRLFSVLLITSGCSSKYVDVQSYELHLQDYAIGLKTLKSVSSKTARFELKYGYNPEYMNDNQRILDNERYNFSLLFTGFYELHYSYKKFFKFEQSLEDFVLDESNAFAKVEKTGFIDRRGRKVTFNKSIECVVDFENVPNTSGDLELALMMPEKAESLEKYAPLLEINLKFIKKDNKITFKYHP